MTDPLLVLASIPPVSGRRVFGERPSKLRHLWIVPEHERPDPRYVVFGFARGGSTVALPLARPTALCGWEQSRRRDATGEVTSAGAVVRAVREVAERLPYTPSLGLDVNVMGGTAREPIAAGTLVTAGQVIADGHATRMPWRTWRSRRDACRELGWCISCVLRLLAPSCRHEDCQEHPSLALACLLGRRST